MVFLDTHVVVWLYDRSLSYLTPKMARAIEENDTCVSPVTRLELGFLHEVGRIGERADVILSYLHNRIGLAIDDISLRDLIGQALEETWTRDPFDRLLVAHCRLRDAGLVSRDRRIRRHYSRTVA